jgi:hypothetical protein
MTTQLIHDQLPRGPVETQQLRSAETDAMKGI